MTWPTHVVFGISALCFLAPLPVDMLGYDMGPLAMAAALGALLPDLDASESKIKHLKLLGTSFKPLHFPAQVVYRSDQHRGLLHSLWGLGIAATFTVPLMWWVGWAPVVALLLGYSSHLLVDSMTKSGIRLLYPRLRRFYLLPKKWRFATGSSAEEVVMIIAATFSLWLLLKSFLSL
jgi:membrane-bound metal-dependent hydrolase YbcI (DUF457 family)